MPLTKSLTFRDYIFFRRPMLVLRRSDRGRTSVCIDILK